MQGLTDLPTHKVLSSLGSEANPAGYSVRPIPVNTGVAIKKANVDVGQRNRTEEGRKILPQGSAAQGRARMLCVAAEWTQGGWLQAQGDI